MAVWLARVDAPEDNAFDAAWLPARADCPTFVAFCVADATPVAVPAAPATVPATFEVLLAGCDGEVFGGLIAGVLTKDIGSGEDLPLDETLPVFIVF